MNRYTPATGLKRGEIETALKLAPYALLSNEYELVQRGVLEGRPLPSVSRFGRGIAGLAASLIGKPPEAKKRPAFFGLLSQRT
jgi:hypothetical protein